MPPGPAPAGGTTLDLSPSPLELNSDNPALTFIVQNDTPGTAYTATAATSCQGANGGIFVAGDGQALTAAAGTPTMFLAYAVGTPPASCQIRVSSAAGDLGTVDATFETIAVQSTVAAQSGGRTPAAVTSGVTPASVTITKANQIATLAVSNFSGATIASAGSCATGASGISVSPTHLAGGSGSIVIAPFGIGAISKSCTVTISDSAGNTSAIPVTIFIPALNKLSVSPGTVQFACAGTVPPLHCRTIQTVTINEAGAAKFSIGTRAYPNKTCATHFLGPVKMVDASGNPGNNAGGPTATVAFDGILPDDSLGCSIIVINDGGDPEQVFGIKVDAQLGAAPPPAIAAAFPPPCKGNNPLVAVPGAPHGMYVWAPTKRLLDYLVSDVIGKDPTLCGASLVIAWADVETQKNVFNWDVVTAAAQPFTDAGLTVNLLFADATEGADTVTPAWVTAPVSKGGDGVPTVTCPTDGTTTPVYFNATYEADWTAFIAAAVKQFSFSNSPLAARVGYMRFGTAGGAEALPPPKYNDGGPCEALWKTAGYSYEAWNTHEANIINAMGSQPTDKQIMVSLPNVSGGPNVYAVSNLGAAAAVAKHVGFSFENLGVSNVAGPNSTPGACNPQAQIVNLHWCQAYTKYLGQVPLAMQPITPTTKTNVATMDITKLLQYALANNIQIFELYPEEWLQADSPSSPGFVPANQAKYKAALQEASLILGATNNGR